MRILKIIFWPLIMIKNILDPNYWAGKVIDRTNMEERVKTSRFVTWKNKLPQPYKFILEITMFVIGIYLVELWLNLFGVSMLPWRWDW